MKTVIKKQYPVLLCVAMLLVACAKVEVSAPDFDVIAERENVALGEDVTFRFSGDPDQIAFYSGELLSDYAFHEGRILRTSSLMTSFSTNVRYGAQADLLSVWLSTDYNGGGTIEDIRSATWSDALTKNFIIAPQSQNSNAVADAIFSGSQDLMQAAIDDKPIYLGFRYKKKPVAEVGAGRNWYIRDIKVEAGSDLGMTTVVNGAAMRLVYDENFTTDDPAVKNSEINAAGVLIMKAPDVLGHLNTETWAITPAISVSEADLGPDRPIAIKGFQNLKAEEFRYNYSTPGTYIATFVATNANIYGEERTVKQVTIIVTE